MLSPYLIDHILNTQSVTSAYAESPPSTTIAHVANRLYPSRALSHNPPKQAAQPDGESKLQTILHSLHIGREDSPSDIHQSKHQHGKAWEQWEQMTQLRQEEMDQVRCCGQWGSSTPSELFLTVRFRPLVETDVWTDVKIYGQALVALEEDSLKGLVSPCLSGSTGVVPLSIISVIPDIIQVKKS